MIRVAAAQFRSTNDPVENTLAVERWARRAVDAGAQLLVCPEATMVNFRTKLAPHAEQFDGRFATALRRIASENGLWLVAGMFEPSGDGRVHNTVVATDGEALHAYRKINLYDAFGSQESRTVTPGTERVTFDALGTTIGLACCYDVRFAEHFIGLRRDGAKLVVLPASWSDGPRKVEQWELVVRARAMDSQSHLIAADQSGNTTGDDKGAPLGAGHSMAIGPLGEVHARLGAEDDLLVADLDLETVEQARRTIPMN